MRRTRASCWASFSPNTTVSGRARCSSFSTTVSTPSKKPGRNWPSSTRPIGPASAVTSGLPAGYISAAGRGENQVHPFGGAHGQVVVQGARVAIKILAGPELERVDEDRHHDAAGGLASAAAARSRVACPACSAPMVGTRMTAPVGRRARRRVRPWSARAPAAPLARCGLTRWHTAAQHPEQPLGVGRPEQPGRQGRSAVSLAMAM